MADKKSKTDYVPRITQLDANEFDKEIQTTLSSELLKIGNYLTPGALNNVKPEINLVLSLLILNYSVAKKNSTFGQELLNLKYKNPLTQKKLIGLALLRCILPYLKNKYENDSSSICNDTVIKVVNRLEVFIKCCQCLNLLIFLREGKFPTIVDRLLNLTYSPRSRLNRGVGYQFMTRELLWHGFMELLMYAVPLINYKAIKRKIKKSFFHASHQIKNEKDVICNIGTKCVICEDPPNLPCRISSYCPHLACYYCIKSNVLADEKFMCPICAETNTVNEKLQFVQL